jgi:sugar/nucleoside kinase (ribokinase family)
VTHHGQRVHRATDPNPDPNPDPDVAAAPQVVVIGAATRDLAADDPRGWRIGGGVSYAALALARLGLRTAALVGADSQAAGSAEVEALREAGVQVRLVRLRSGPVFENIETSTGRVQRCLARSDPMPPDALPGAWRDSGAWLFAPVADEVPAAWAGLPGSAALVALGWQGLLRDLAEGTAVRHRAPVPSALLARADLVGVGRDDLDQSTSIEELVGLLRPGARLLLTHGSGGGLAVEVGADGRPLASRAWPAIPAAATVDPTGAGDVFLAGVLAARAEPRLVGGRAGNGWDLRLGAAMASLTCEARGLAGVPGRTAIRVRLGSRSA